MKLHHYKLFMLAFFISSMVFAQQQVTGTVQDEKGLPLPGVNILIKGQSTGAQTDFDGKYTITTKAGDILVYSYLGFVSQEITITDQTTEFNVTLLEDVSALEEVVVVGFGTQSRKKITANIASIGSDQIKEIPTPSIQSSLTGKAAGVRVTQLNGKVEGGIKVRVRGVATISSSQEPLYVVDGIPITNDDESSNDSPINPLIAINPNDIESIDILKDASSAAIYGARGTNGVIIITTKQGKQGKTKVSINSSYGISQATNKRDWLNASQYIELFTESGLNNGFTQAEIEAEFERLSNGTDWRNGAVDTDWQDLALVEGSVQDFNVSISGGSEKTRFFISTSYNNTDGIVRGNQLERYSFRTNLDHTISDKFKVGGNTTVSKSTIDRISNDNAFATPLQAIAQSPLSPAFLDNGIPNNDSTEYYNFLTEEFNGNFRTNIWRVLANTYLQYQILPDLNFRTEVGYDFLSQVAERFSGSLTESASVGGSANYNAVQTEKYNLNNYFTYNKIFKDTYDFEGTLGMSYEDSFRRRQNATGQGFPSDDLQTLDSAAEITAGGSSRTRFNFLSYFGRARLSVANKYLFNASLRYDGSSRFGADNRFGWFPAASAGWIVSEEDFLKKIDIMSLLKVRGSWGITGNAGIGNFASLSLFQGSPYNQRAGLAPTQLGNSSIKWERTTQVDFGIDFGFLNNRITGEVDYYVKNTEDLLLDEPVPGTSGFTTITRNVGELSNKGFEFVINTKNITTQDLTWSTSFNLATLDNEVTELPGGDIITGRNIVREGETLSSFFLVEFAGADPANGDALFIRNSVNADGSIDRSTTNNFNEAERVIAGSPYPDFIAGITNSVSYKGIDFSFTFQGEWGASIYNNGGRFQSGNARFFDNQTVDQLDRWQQPGDITNVPQPRLFSTNGQQASTRYLQESDFIRLRNLTLGYTIPQDITGKFQMDKVRIYFTGFNLLTITDYDGYDPESTADFNGDSNIQVGETFYSAPPAKTYTLGVNIDF